MKLEDAHGRLVLDYLEGRAHPEVVERSDGLVLTSAGPENYFAPYPRRPGFERRALRYVRVRVGSWGTMGSPR